MDDPRSAQRNLRQGNVTDKIVRGEMSIHLPGFIKRGETFWKIIKILLK